MGAVDYFLKIDGIEGESEDSIHKGEIELESWSWGETQAGTSMFGKGSGAGRVTMQDFQFVKRVDKSSPKLLLGCCNGQHFTNAQLTARKAGSGPQEYLHIYFSEIIISSYQTSGSASTDIVPREQLSFNYTKVEVEYREQKPDGTLGGPTKRGYDLKANFKV